MIEIDERIRRPESLLELLTRDDFAGSFQQRKKNLEGLFLKPDARSVAAQLAGAQVHFKGSEADHRQFIGLRNTHSHTLKAINLAPLDQIPASYLRRYLYEGERFVSLSKFG